MSELEAQASKDKASVIALDTAKAALAARVVALESQCKKDEVSTEAIVKAKVANESSMSEMATQLKMDQVTNEALMKAKKTDEARILVLESQVKKDEATLAALMKAKAVSDTTLSQLEKQVQLDHASTEALLKAKKTDEARILVLEGHAKAADSGKTVESVTSTVVASQYTSSASAVRSKVDVLPLGQSVVLPSLSNYMRPIGTPSGHTAYGADGSSAEGTRKLSTPTMSLNSPRNLESESDELDAIPNECGDSDDESDNVTCLIDRARDSKWVYKKFVGRVFENLKLGKPGSPTQRSTEVYRTFMINSIVRLSGKKQLYFVYYDVLAYPKGPPSKEEADAWTLCPCRHLIGKTKIYRFK